MLIHFVCACHHSQFQVFSVDAARRLANRRQENLLEIFSHYPALTSYFLQAEREAWLKVIKLEKEREDREHEKWLQRERERKVFDLIILADF